MPRTRTRDPWALSPFGGYQPNGPIVESLRADYKDWFEDVTKNIHQLPWPLQLDPEIQDPVVLTRRDWSASNVQDHFTGHWYIHTKENTDYLMEVAIRKPLKVDANILVECGNRKWEVIIPAGTLSIKIPKIQIPAGNNNIMGKVFVNGEHVGGVYYIKLAVIKE